MAVITAHSTTGIVVNESLPFVEADISEMLEKTVPLEAPYLHAHFLPTYGAPSNNSQGHLKSVLTGNHCMFPVVDGEVVCGGAQDVSLVAFDGQQLREVSEEGMGE